ncbi:hypothetical protein QYE76_050588 [Lolium multiflorum]|uniref:DUF4218 domain-containing protein n=1 Tax=Lolium multiflorum TaxID=4521 RepID=A0AAD8SRJ2_LOLMU|nr:hypothetical protein QYE76_050588 [Lolium multiflorum]
MMEDGDEEEDNDDQYRSMFSECDDTAMEDNEEEGGEEQAADDPVDDDLRRAISDARRDCGTDKERLQFDKMLEDHHKLLYPGCEDGQRKLGSILELLKWKAEVGLDVQKIHACINDCILYRGEKYENLNKCPICGALRYKIRKDDPGDVEGEPPRKRVPAKVMWYAPIIPRLKRLFRNKEHAKLLRWHMEERKKDVMLRHPADGRQWRNIGREFPDFAGEARNLYFGLSTDGMNPFGEQSCSHSTWPVTLCIYNLPPWLCMKRKFIMMPVLIQGPKQPGNDIDVYLRPLVDELLELWGKPGVRVWDEHTEQEFNLRALLFVTINDWPALSNISGQTNKGYNACTHCLDETESKYLGKSRKVVYPFNRRFLPHKHPLRKKGKHFDGEADRRPKPVPRSGADIFDMVKDLNVIFGKGPGSRPVPKDADGHAPMWKKKSIFWELEYWKALEVRSAIDVMHLTKNLCVNILGFLGVYGKSKDTTEAREDQKHHKGRDGNHPGKFEGPASYALTKQEKEIFFEALFSIKVPSGFSSNIKGIVNMKEKKFQNLKSHDCHVLMTQLLPVALRGLLPENVRLAIVKICAFLNAISQKVMDPETLSGLQEDVVECLVSFELLFPPSFFNIMTHLLVHLVEEIRILGPVFLHNMFPFERFMGVLKKYVHNRARPEGSISKGYGTEEVIEFCVDFLPDLKPIGVPESRYEGRLTGKGTLGRKATVCRDKISFNQAHYTVLYNSILVAPYIEKHKNVLREINPGQPESLITRQHMNTFGSWLQRHLMNTTVVEQLYLLAKLPSSNICTFQGNPTFGKILGIYAEGPILPKYWRSQKGKRGGGPRAPHHMAARPRGAARPCGVASAGLDAPGLLIGFDLKTHGERSKSPEAAIAKLHLGSRRKELQTEELLAKIGRNHDDWSTPEPTPTPIVKKRGMIKLNDEDMREAKKSLKEKGIKPEDVKNLPPIEDICETIPPSSMIEYMKDIVTNKRKIPNEEISTMLANYSFNGKIPKKLGDPDKLIPTDISLQMADKSTAIPVGLCENVPVQVTQHCLILTDFVVLEMPEDDNMSIILGRPFLNTAGAVIDCNKGMVTFNVDDKETHCLFSQED